LTSGIEMCLLLPLLLVVTPDLELVHCFALPFTLLGRTLRGALPPVLMRATAEGRPPRPMLVVVGTCSECVCV
jgi:hypothetical protein